MVDRGSSCRVNRYTLTRSLEKLLKDAHLCGELNLSGQKLKEFPKSNKYDLSDTTTAGTMILPDTLTLVNVISIIRAGVNCVVWK